MPTNKKESLIYTTVMCFFMVYFMSVYNIFLAMGFSVSVLQMAWNELPLALIVAFILDWFVVSGPAKALAFKFLDKDSSPRKKVIVISSFMICGMVFFMSLYGALIHTGLSSAVFGAWLVNIGKNVIVALPLQLLIAGPIVRKFFRHLFPIGSIKDITTA